MLWATLLAFYLVANVGYTLLLKSSPLPKANRHITHLLMTITLGLSAGVGMLLGYGDWTPSKEVWLLILLQTAFFFCVNQINIVALNHLDASLFTILQSFRIVIVTVLGIILLGDKPTTFEMIGGGFILVSIVVLKLHKNKQYLSKPILLGIAATLLMSFNVVAEKNLLNKTTVVTEFFWTSLITAPILLTIIARQKNAWTKSLPHIKNVRTVALSLLRPTSAWLYSIAVAIGSVAVTNYVSSLSVVFVVIFGILILKERQQMRQKLLSLTFAFCGLTIIMLSRL